MKILCTGDRNWDDIETVARVLQEYPTDTILVHGAARGADLICGLIGKALGFTVREYPADWDAFGRAAGPIRNRHVIKVEHIESEPINGCIAFHDDLPNSKGTKDMVDLVVNAEIHVRYITSRSKK